MMETGLELAQYRAPALEKGLDILELLAATAVGLTQAEIAKALERSPNEIYRMLDTLLRRGYAVRTGDTYLLSLKLYALAHQHPPLRSLIAAATPLLRELSLWSEQSCHLTTYDRGQVVVVSQIDSPGYYGLSIRLASRIDLVNTGSGHVLLAFASPEDRQLMLRERALTGDTRVPAAFNKRLDRVKRRGYERMKSEQIRGVVNLSAPIVGGNGVAVAALTVPFMQRLDGNRSPGVEDVLQRARDVAAQLSQLINGGKEAVETPGRRRGTSGRGRGNSGEA